MTALAQLKPDSALIERIEDYVEYRREGQHRDAAESLARLMGELAQRIDAGFTRRELGPWMNRHSDERVLLDEPFFARAVERMHEEGLGVHDGERVARQLPGAAGPRRSHTRTAATRLPSAGTLPTLAGSFPATQPTMAPPSGRRPLQPTSATVGGTQATLDTMPPVRRTVPTATRMTAVTAGSWSAGHTLEPGAPLTGTRSYTLERRVGQGGMGQVWRATIEGDADRVVAIKTVRTRSSALDQALSREVRMLRSLNRADLFPTVHEAIHAGGQLFMVMDWVEGRTLREVVAGGLASLDHARFFSILSQVVECLSYLHTWQPRPIVFRDLKPSNVMLDPATEHLRLVDFGISHVVVEGEDRVRAATPGWIAPEVARGEVTPSTDVFALGRLALFMLFGDVDLDRLPPDAAVPMGFGRRLHDGVVNAARRLMSRRPARRASTVGEALEWLRSANRPAGSDDQGDEFDRERCPVCQAVLAPRHRVCSTCGGVVLEASQPRGPQDVPSITEHELQLPPGAASRARPHQQRALEGLVETRARADLGTLRCLPLISVQPYRYQQQAAVRVISEMGGRALIADDVGLGKTIEAGLVIREYLHRGMARRVLIVSPPGLLLDQIRLEMKEKFHLDFVQYKGHVGARDESDIVGPGQLAAHNLIIVSLHTLRRAKNLDQFLELDWDLMVVDECHHIKRQTTRSYRAIRQIIPRYVLFMSATPFSGDPDELWTVYSALRPAWLGSNLASFRKTYFKDHRSKRPREPLPALRQRVRDLTIRRRRAELLIRFPARKAVRVNVPVDPRFQGVYANVAAAAAEHAHGFLDRSTLLQQVCSSYESLADNRFWTRMPSQQSRFIRGLPDDDHPKARWLIDRVLPAIPPDEKLLIFTRFRKSQRALTRLIRKSGRGVRALIQAAGRGRTRILSEFMDQRNVQVLVCGEGAGEGLNLQRASLLINYDLPWNPMRVEQRIGRIQRLGQRRKSVTVVNLVTHNTIEAQVLDVMERKIDLFNNLMGDTEQILGKLFRSDDQQGARASFESWIASVMLPDGLMARDALRELGRELDKAKRDVRRGNALDGSAFDRVFGHPDDASADGPVPDLPGLDLSDLSHV